MFAHVLNSISVLLEHVLCCANNMLKHVLSGKYPALTYDESNLLERVLSSASVTLKHELYNITNVLVHVLTKINATRENAVGECR